MRSAFLSVAVFIFFVSAYSQPAESNRLITKTFVYLTGKASDAYLVWSTDYWKTPEKKYWPENTMLKGTYAYTKMNRQKDSFWCQVTLPSDKRMDYYFWFPLNEKGDSMNAWDTYMGNTYSTNYRFSQMDKHQDQYLVISKTPFSILSKGKYILLFSIALLVACLLFFDRRGKCGGLSFLYGLLFSAFLYIAAARLEILKAPSGIGNLIGALYKDVGCLFIVSFIFFSLLYVTKKHRLAFNISYWLFVACIGLIVVLSILNIEVVRQLGTPFSYKWLYYSDFLKGNDAKAGLANTLTPWYVTNVCSLLVSFFIVGYCFQIPLGKLLKKQSVQYSLLLAVPLVIGTSRFFHYRFSYKNAEVESPVFAFLESILYPAGKTALMKQVVDPRIVKDVARYHHSMDKASSPNVNIDKVILFVSESTPAAFVSGYRPGYEYTPSIKKWLAISELYSNMYAHLPSTPNSMLSLVSGIYPMTDYKTALIEKVSIPKPSLPRQLEAEGWKTSLFFSSDLIYSNMITYAKEQGFSFITDNKTMTCAKKFSTTKTEMDGIDDSCLVKNYFQWVDSSRGGKKFSILWTNQTHSPYYSDTEYPFIDRNPSLNLYLNALHHTDRVFGALMEELQRRGILHSTLVIFLADHGEAFGTHDQKLHGAKVYEENVHIPFILFNPKLFNGKRNETIGGLIDVAPSLSDILGIGRSSEWQGKSLIAENANGRTFFISPYTDLIMGTRWKNWKYIYNADTKSAELYDLENDPGELKNLSALQPELAQEQYDYLIAWFQFVNKNYDKWQQAAIVTKK